MQLARVFQSGNSQAVRLPKAFRFNKDTVEILKRGNEVILREHVPTACDIFDALAALPSDGFDTLRHDTPPQEREPF